MVLGRDEGSLLYLTDALNAPMSSGLMISYPPFFRRISTSIIAFITLLKKFPTYICT